MRLDYDDYSKGFCKALYQLIAISLDFALMPYCLYVTWNYCVPDLFGLPRVSFYHVILFKLCILFFIPSIFSDTYEYSHRENKHRYYVNAIYEELQRFNINQEILLKKLKVILRKSDMSQSYSHSFANQNRSGYCANTRGVNTILPYNAYDNIHAGNDNNV